MTFEYPMLIVGAAVALVVMLLAYRWLHRQRTKALAGAGLSTKAGLRRHIPPLVFVAALTVLLVGAARPQATVRTPRIAGTVILAFDVSNSMTADDVKPTRLAAAQEAAIGFVDAQPDSVNIGVVAFDQGAITTHQPAEGHATAVAAIKQLHTSGSTSLGQAILASLTTITGKAVSLPDAQSGAPAPDLGYWGSATIILLSDGEDTGGPDALAAADLAAKAGVHIETIGVGTVEGATIEVDGYQIATSLDEDMLTQIATTTTGSYHRADNADAIRNTYKKLDLRLTSKPELMELTGEAVGTAILLLTIGGLLMIMWYGRIL